MYFTYGMIDCSYVSNLIGCCFVRYFTYEMNECNYISNLIGCCFVRYFTYGMIDRPVTLVAISLI